MKVKRNIRTAANEKLERDHNKLVQQLVEQYRIYKHNREEYERSKSKCLSLVLEIYSTELWRKTHISFTDFIKDSLGIQKSQAYRILEAANLIEEQTDSGEPPAPTERAARRILDTQKKGGSSAENNHRNGSGSNTTIFPPGGMAKSEKSGSGSLKKDKKIVFSVKGTPIPDDALQWWEKRKEVAAILKKISDLKNEVLKLRKPENFHWMKVSNTIESDFSYLYSLIKEAYPYEVCTTCMGVPSLQEKGCSACHSTGLISKRYWDTCSMKEIKEIRMKSNADFAKTHPDSPLNKPQKEDDDV